MFSCINSFRMYNNLLNKSIIKFKNRKLKSVRIFLYGVKIFLAKKVYAIPGVIPTAKIWFQNSFMFVKFPSPGHPRSFHCSGHYYRSILWRSMTKMIFNVYMAYCKLYRMIPTSCGYTEHNFIRDA